MHLKCKAKIGVATSKLQLITLIICLSLDVYSSHVIKLFSFKIVVEAHINSGPMYSRTDTIAHICISNSYFPKSKL